MLLSKPNDIASTVVMTPIILRDYLLPIRVGCVHGIVDGNNFDKIVNGALTGYRNNIEEVIDIPSGGKLFVGKWLDFTGDTVDNAFNIRYQWNAYFEKLQFTTCPSGKTVDGKLWWRVTHAGAPYILEVGTYVGTTFTAVAATTLVVGLCGLVQVAGSGVAGFLVCKSVPTAAITIDVVNMIDVNPFLDAANNNAIAVYARFSDMAHYANQMTHFIRSMEFQVSMSRESMQSMTQGIYSPVKGKYDSSNGWNNDPIPVAPKGEKSTPDAMRDYRREMAVLFAPSPAISITNKFRIEKPYASDFLCFNATGASKMSFVDAEGDPKPNKMHYEAFVSAESDDELEITISSYFENNEVFGDSDYSFCTGKLEMTFEGRI